MIRSILGTMLCSLLISTSAHAAKQPNILFMFSDDHAYQAISAYGHGLNKTPNLDRIANEGMRFDRCLITNSICGPSRAVVLTGKYSHMNGFYNNTNSKFDGTQVTMPKLLKAAGYQTAIVGKWHLISDPTGFDFWEVLPGQGAYYNPAMIRNGEKLNRTGYVTDLITEDTLDWLKTKRDPNKPFLMMMQHKAPHREWEPALRHLSMYDNVKFPEPPSLFDDYAGRGKAEKEQDMTISRTMTRRDNKLDTPGKLTDEQRKAWDAHYGPINEAFAKANLKGEDLVRWKYQRYMQDYLATIAAVDESIGKVLDYLKEAGLENDTIVVYSSDQGFYLGEHGWFDKRWIFEESLRTPLLVRWPGVVKPGTTTAQIVSNVDFAQTFLEAAGVEAPKEMQGRSLVPVLKSQPPADWRKSFYYHYYEHPAVHSVARHYGVVTDQYKLVYFYEPQFNYWELFDLKADPKEMKSVYNDPKYADVQKELHKELDRLRAELKVPAQDPPETDLGKRGAGAGAAAPGKPLNAWALDFQFDKDEQGKAVDASGHKNNGTAKGTTVVAGRDGRKALQFDGQSFIDVAKSASLNPGVGAISVEITFNAQKPDGILIAHGGASNGYCLALEAGKPVLTVVGGDEATRIESKNAISAGWNTIRASYDGDKAAIDVNGTRAAEGTLKHPLDRNPADNLQIGADTGSLVTGKDLPKFNGLIERVRIFSGKEPAPTSR